MRNQKIIAILVVSFFLFLVINTSSSQASSNPVLNFSDITSGPATGLGDGLGEGVIVTIWGNNLGSSQGDSTIMINGAPPSHVYHWGNATIQAGHPADLYTYHKMQYVQFSISSSATDGAGTISLTVDGVTSNTLPFTVRSGNIKFVMPGGNDTTGNGSWASPWLTPYKAQSSTSPGDIVYFGAISQETWTQMTCPNGRGTEAAPYAFLAYPGMTPIAKGSSGRAAFNNWVVGSNYWVFSRFSLFSDTSLINVFDGSRIVANSGADVSCNNGQSGDFGTGCDVPIGMKFYGNYIYGTSAGCSAYNNKVHVTYFSNRQVSGCSGYGAWSEEHQNGPIDFSWNYLENNASRFGIHFYDENVCGGWSGTHIISSNVIKNQVGPAINFSGNCADGYHMQINAEVNNNLIINSGLHDLDDNTYSVVSINTNYLNCYDASCHGLEGNINFSNNTIVGSGVDAQGFITSYGLVTAKSTATYKWENNIIWKNNSTPWDSYVIYHAHWSYPETSDHNLWHYSGGTTVAPTWDTAPIITNPSFVNLGSNDFSLQSTSPAIDAGTTFASTPTDFLGTSRPQGSAYDIGAFEYVSAAPETCTDNIQNQDETGIDCGGVCDACIIPTTYNLTNFISAITNWLGIGNETSDVNSDGIVNSRDLGVVMSGWE
jgi:hypothetical protein